MNHRTAGNAGKTFGFDGIGWTVVLLVVAIGSVRCGTEPAASASGDFYFFAFGKAMVRDEMALQERGYDAVQRVSGALAGSGQYRFRILQEHVRDLDEYTQDPTPFRVSSDIIAGELQRYARELTGNDTIVIYSHSHGRKNTEEQGLGGLALDDPWTEVPPTITWLDWSSYADLLLDLPAKNVVVLTMACFSGALVDFLNESPTAERWLDRREQGRNFVVITSQNAEEFSSPSRIDGEIINPFTYALIQAFEGEADGYRAQSEDGNADGILVLSEFVDYVLSETRKYPAAADPENIPDPQVTGSYDPTWAMVSGLKKTGTD
jgi:hypothetical protein